MRTIQCLAESELSNRGQAALVLNLVAGQKLGTSLAGLGNREPRAAWFFRRWPSLSDFGIVA